ncbi:1-acyl-sn-glycerol-3-phosphate acyltransferase [Candidatus Babeliales bacterium]|nr:1-acyl-sn-glycerol-3-phosphate acyltransferase [Candidatus Babeliales bacterium]
MRYDNRIYFFLTNIWNRLLIFFSFIFLRVDGEENLSKYPDNPSIIIANHSSALDIFLLESILGSYPRVWFSKASYEKIPIFNIFLKKMHILVKRKNPKDAFRALYKAYDLLKLSSRHLVMFPEGRRYDDGKIHNFFSGFAILAKKLNRPVIPITIVGTNKIFPKNRFVIDAKASDVKIVIGKPIKMKHDEMEKDFVKRIHDWYTKCIF